MLADWLSDNGFVILSSTPAYLSDLIPAAVPARLVQSSDDALLNVPRIRTGLAVNFAGRMADVICML